MPLMIQQILSLLLLVSMISLAIVTATVFIARKRTKNTTDNDRLH